MESTSGNTPLPFCSCNISANLHAAAWCNKDEHMARHNRCPRHLEVAMSAHLTGARRKFGLRYQRKTLYREQNSRLNDAAASNEGV